LNRAPQVRILPAASQSVASQADYYISVSESNLHERWRRAVAQSFATLLTVPNGGALCDFADSKLAFLRRWPIHGFPNHLIIYRYFPESNTLLVVDIVHGARELPARLLGFQLPDDL